MVARKSSGYFQVVLKLSENEFCRRKFYWNRQQGCYAQLWWLFTNDKYFVRLNLQVIQWYWFLSDIDSLYFLNGTLCSIVQTNNLIWHLQPLFFHFSPETCKKFFICPRIVILFLLWKGNNTSITSSYYTVVKYHIYWIAS